MTGSAAIFFAIVALALLIVPRRWAPLPLLIGVCYMTRAQAVEIGTLTITVMRLLVAVGLCRIVLRREGLGRPLDGLDQLLLAWGVWMIVSVAFHTDPATQVILRIRYVIDGWGLYFLLRSFCRSPDEALDLLRLVCIAVGPLALMMLVEMFTSRNVFAVFGGVHSVSQIRYGTVRAQGPFAHSILAGTIGAVLLPLFVGIITLRPLVGLTGMCVSVAMVVASGSSGPIISGAAALLGLSLWPFRKHLRVLILAAAAGYILLVVVMNSPPYYLIARVGLRSGSTGWYRARLIDSSLAHISEWWLIGTDVTRHWMPRSPALTPEHIDITNQYLAMGVYGGVPLILLFVAVLGEACRLSIRAATTTESPHVPFRFAAWGIGVSMFTHAVAGISVSYFDNSIFFFYLSLAAARATAIDIPVLASVEPSGSARPRTRWRRADSLRSRRRLRGARAATLLRQ